MDQKGNLIKKTVFEILAEAITDDKFDIDEILTREEPPEVISIIQDMFLRVLL